MTDITKKELYDFFTQMKGNYISTFKYCSGNLLYIELKKREAYKDIVKITKDIINIQEDTYGKKVSSKYNKALQKKIIKRESCSERLKPLANEIINNRILPSIIERELAKESIKINHGLNRLTFMDVFIASKNAHKNVEEHVEFFKKLHGHLIFPPKKLKMVKMISDKEIKGKMLAKHNEYKKTMPDTYANPISEGKYTQSWVSIDLSLSDELLKEKFEIFLANERKRNDIIAIDHKLLKHLDWKNKFMKQINVMNLFMIIDINIVALFYNIPITQQDILDILGSSNEKSKITEAIALFTDAFLPGNMEFLLD